MYKGSDILSELLKALQPKHPREDEVVNFLADRVKESLDEREANTADGTIIAERMIAFIRQTNQLALDTVPGPGESEDTAASRFNDLMNELLGSMSYPELFLMKLDMRHFMETTQHLAGGIEFNASKKAQALAKEEFGEDLIDEISQWKRERGMNIISLGDL